MSRRRNRHTLRALATLLRPPDAGWRAMLPTLVQAIDAEAALGAPRRRELRLFAQDLHGRDLPSVQAAHAQVFCDVHGVSLRLGRQAPAAAGPPQHLCDLLTFAAEHSPADAHELLARSVPDLQAIFAALLGRASGYASVLGAVLELAGVRSAPVALDSSTRLDGSWAAPEPQAPCPAQRRATTSAAHFASV